MTVERTSPPATRVASSSPGSTSSGDRTTRPSARRVIDQPRASVRSGSRAPQPGLDGVEDAVVLGQRPGAGGRPAARDGEQHLGGAEVRAAGAGDPARVDGEAVLGRSSPSAAARWRRGPSPSSRGAAEAQADERARRRGRRWRRAGRFRRARAWVRRASERAGVVTGAARRGRRSRGGRGGRWRSRCRRAALQVRPTWATRSCAHAVGVLADGVGDLVGHRRVDLVADAGEHGHGAGGDRARDGLVVERGEVGARATAPHERDARRAGGWRPSAAPTAIDRAASVPCTVALAFRTTKANPLPPQLVEEVGLGGAPSLVTSPTRSGASGSSSGGVGSQQALGLEPPRAAPPAPSRAGRACRRGRSPSSAAAAAPRGEYQSSRPRMRTSVPSFMRTAPPARPERAVHGRLLGGGEHHPHAWRRRSGRRSRG